MKKFFKIRNKMKKNVILIFFLFLLVIQINWIEGEEENGEREIYCTQYIRMTVSGMECELEWIYEFRYLGDSAYDRILKMDVPSLFYAPKGGQWSSLNSTEWEDVPEDNILFLDVHLESGDSNGIIFKNNIEDFVGIEEGYRRIRAKSDTIGYSENKMELRLPLKEGFHELSYFRCNNPPNFERDDEYYKTLRWDNPTPILEKDRLINEIIVFYDYKIDFLSATKYFGERAIWVSLIPFLGWLNKKRKKKKQKKKKG